MSFIYGLMGVGVGFLLVRYSVQLTDWFGRIELAERYLRGGLAGTYTMYRLVGVIFIVLSLMYMFGGFDLILSPLAPLFGGAK